MSVEIDTTTCGKVCVFSFLLALGGACDAQAPSSSVFTSSSSTFGGGQYDDDERAPQVPTKAYNPYSNFDDVSFTVDELEKLVPTADLETLRGWYSWLHCGVLVDVQAQAQEVQGAEAEKVNACVEKLNNIIAVIEQRVEELEANTALSPPPLEQSLEIPRLPLSLPPPPVRMSQPSPLPPLPVASQSSLLPPPPPLAE